MENLTFKSWLNLTLTSLNNWFNQTFIKPVKTFFTKEKSQKEKEAEEFLNKQKEAELKRQQEKEKLISEFETEYNINHKRTLEIINFVEQPNVLPPHIIDLFKENATNINSLKEEYNFRPKLYNPEIIEIHNENLNPENPTLNELIIKNRETDNLELLKQEKFEKRKDKLKYGIVNPNNSKFNKQNNKNDNAGNIESIRK
jgi:hypothetical protein